MLVIGLVWELLASGHGLLTEANLPFQPIA